MKYPSCGIGSQFRGCRLFGDHGLSRLSKRGISRASSTLTVILPKYTGCKSTSSLLTKLTHPFDRIDLYSTCETPDLKA